MYTKYLNLFVQGVATLMWVWVHDSLSTSTMSKILVNSPQDTVKCSPFHLYLCLNVVSTWYTSGS